MRAIDADDFGNRMYHEVFEKDSDDQKWDSGCWIRYKMFERVLREAPTIEPERKWSGLWSEPKNDSSVYGEKLMEGDTVYLLGVEGTVRYENGAWGWGSCNYVPWEELEKKMPHNNQPDFCYCDNFISFWELKWNFDDGYDWDGVPFIRHGMDMREDAEEPKKCDTCKHEKSRWFSRCADCSDYELWEAKDEPS